MSTGKKVHLSIVSGFLGAGNTTFIRKLLSDVYVNEKVVVLENEFGKIDLDSETLARDAILVEGIRGGCICCSSKALLASGIEKIIEKYHPDAIVIEPTGVARLTDILSALREPFIREHCDFRHIVSIVDAKNFFRRIDISKTFFEDQISASRVIFLSKTDGMESGLVESVREAVSGINPECRIEVFDWDRMDRSRWHALLAYSVLPGAPGLASESVTDAAAFQTFSLEDGGRMTVERMRDFFEQVRNDSFGIVCRAKGIFRTPECEWFTCEYVPGEARVLPVRQISGPVDAALKICVIGMNLNCGKMRAVLLRNMKTSD